jgi:hypothetical protein
VAITRRCESVGVRPGLLVLVVVLVLGAGLLRFAGARPAIETAFPRRGAETPGRANLAQFSEGSTLRVSSVEWALRHHPGYLVDGHERPIPIEKWVSARSDPAPWADVLLDRVRDVDEVALELAGAHEPAEYTMRAYRIDCFRGEVLRSSRWVGSNDEPRPRHEVSCRQVDRVRVTFGVEPRSARDVARVYELEVWGK